MAETVRQLRQAVEATEVPTGRGPLAVTVGIGAARLRPDESLAELLARAERALRANRRSG